MLFRRNIIECPIEDWVRRWLEDTFKWIIYEFGINTITLKKVLCPIKEDFPVEFKDIKQASKVLLPIISGQMNVDYNKIELGFYTSKPIEFITDIGGQIPILNDESISQAAFFNGVNEHGKYSILLNTTKINCLEELIAAIAHEVGHIILTNIKAIETYDEYLVDLLTVIFGLGIFNANVAFKFFKSRESWGFTKQGYLRQQDWAFALALYCYIRKEKDNCTWSKYLDPNVKSFFSKSIKYIVANPINI